MTRNRLAVAAALSVIFAAGSASVVSRVPNDKEDLAKALAGRTAGQPTRCVPHFRSSDIKVFDNGTIVVGEGKTVYLQKPAGDCSALGLAGNSLVARQYATNRMCEGDINEVVDVRNGITVGSCVFQSFVPFTRSK